MIFLLGEGDIDFGKIFALTREENIEVPWSVEIEFVKFVLGVCGSGSEEIF